MVVRYGVSTVPINGFRLASKMGVTVIPYSATPESKRWLLFKKSEDGFTVEKSIGEWYIYYDDRSEYGRINNTIMHEIGHIVLDHSEGSELAEKEAKFFAKYALVPPVLVHKLGLDNPMDIVSTFDVSFEAACYAYSYYKKWRQHGFLKYTKYEATLLQLFQGIS